MTIAPAMKPANSPKGVANNGQKILIIIAAKQ